MKKIGVLLTMLILALFCMGLIVRHDVSDAKFIALGKKYPQLCHLVDGEATLLSASWFVTAAHTAIRLQEDIDNGIIPQVQIDHKFYAVKKVILHPDYKLSVSEIENDIALFQIDGTITTIPAAKLYRAQDERGKKITIVGRGDFGNGLTGPVKRDSITRAATNRIDATHEQWVLFTFDRPESGNATEFEGVSGPGDSGGPAFIEIGGELYIAGVSSHQRSNGQQGIYGVTEYYARISYYASWIAQTMN